MNYSVFNYVDTCDNDLITVSAASVILVELLGRWLQWSRLYKTIRDICARHTTDSYLTSNQGEFNVSSDLWYTMILLDFSPINILFCEQEHTSPHPWFILLRKP